MLAPDMSKPSTVREEPPCICGFDFFSSKLIKSSLIKTQSSIGQNVPNFKKTSFQTSQLPSQQNYPLPGSNIHDRFTRNSKGDLNHDHKYVSPWYAHPDEPEGMLKLWKVEGLKLKEQGVVLLNTHHVS